MYQRIQYAKHIVVGLIGAMPKSAIQKLYDQHIAEVEAYNDSVTEEFDQPGKTLSAHYLRKPSATITSFKVSILPAIIYLRILETNLGKSISGIEAIEVGHLLTMSVADVTAIELRVKRILRRPKNKLIVENLLTTNKRITLQRDVGSHF